MSSSDLAPKGNGKPIPSHVAIIMDGNGRWAENQHKHRLFGHKAGIEAVRASVRYARKNGVKSLTLFAFSSENWQRPEKEVSGLMDLFSMVLTSEVKRLHKNDIKLQVIGDLSKFSSKLQTHIKKASELTANNTSLTLNIAANYGGRWDIINAAKQLSQDVLEGKLQPQDICETTFGAYTQLADLPELDLLIRTGGETRVSNFLLWQLAYTELVFTPVLWPEFTESVFADIVSDYQGRERRFGLTGAQVSTPEQREKSC